ncbi:class I SAM-dependent methyltransferase [Paenibacillus sp. MER TA 81-3]|uniref:class I SAM-dependent methyltransferase n=1 Tax=Paenibacillus sp. MER TA 81-3 TaxID=2939573 RepID=UPI0020412C03|nr:class I SAM-dependent methyltransferase [Paenibacillus sp. MER TA 81-3]MCM3339508.1 class I SAM-dependent methyltransferase [Paenibacillus sp. MER TA 81-3]
MLVFWEKVILPLLNWAGAKKIVEIGSEFGGNTYNLLHYCSVTNGELFVIDPAPQYDVHEYKRMYHKQFHMILDYSLEMLPHLNGYDFVLIDGDHNWYTVYNELKIIESMAMKTGKFPLVLLHDTQWPYGRRDMYYFPESIPPAFTIPYAQKGMEQDRSELVESGGVNWMLNNAIYENGERNGVLTAIEDFLQHTRLHLSFHQLHSHSGLGIITTKNRYSDEQIKTILSASQL